MDTTCVHSALRGQKRVSEPLEVELQMVWNHHVSAEQVPVFFKSNKCS